MKRRKLKQEAKIILAVLSVLFIAYYAWYVGDLKARREAIEEININHLPINKDTGFIELTNYDLDPTRTTDVYFTNYHLGDGSSGITTASGLQIKDFEVNEDDMYTYDGKVVVATINMSRYPRGIVEGYQSHELYEEFTIRLNDKEYQAIVLDVCGACYGMFDEQLQRYDIFTTKDWIGKVVGQVIKGDFK